MPRCRSSAWLKRQQGQDVWPSEVAPRPQWASGRDHARASSVHRVRIQIPRPSPEHPDDGQTFPLLDLLACAVSTESLPAVEADRPRVALSDPQRTRSGGHRRHEKALPDAGSVPVSYTHLTLPTKRIV